MLRKEKLLPHHIQNVEDASGIGEDTIQDGV
jgi:hypothetical protein